FEQIAPIVERTPVATRKLASRARQRVRGASPVSDPDITHQRAVIDAFLAASRNGDFDALVAVLDPDVVFRFAAGLAPDRRPPVPGAEPAARRIPERGAPLAHLARPAIVNGAAGLIVASERNLVSVVGFTVANGLVKEIYIVADPDKLPDSEALGH